MKVWEGERRRARWRSVTSFAFLTYRSVTCSCIHILLDLVLEKASCRRQERLLRGTRGERLVRVHSVSMKREWMLNKARLLFVGSCLSLCACVCLLFLSHKAKIVRLIAILVCVRGCYLSVLRACSSHCQCRWCAGGCQMPVLSWGGELIWLHKGSCPGERLHCRVCVALSAF